MQIWKKYYLLTYILFLLVLNSSMLVFLTTSFNNDFEREAQNAGREEKKIESLLTAADQEEINYKYMRAILGNYRNEGTYLMISRDGETVYNTLPEENTGWDTFAGQLYLVTPGNGVKVVSIKNHKYLGISTSVISGNDNFDLFYLKDAEYLYNSQTNRIVSGIGISLVLSIFIGVMLYLAMNRINKPVNNLAHELRTPLTNIQGYAQYLTAGKITEEDRYFAQSQLIKETKNLKDIVEKLLMVGSLGRGAIYEENIDMADLWAELKKYYPDLKVTNKIKSLKGDRLLIKSLLNNLISNADKHGENVEVLTEDNSIIIQNDGPALSREEVINLNKKYPLEKRKPGGMGYGVELCHEIVKLHKGRLVYQSDAEHGTMVIVKFPVRIRTLISKRN